MPPLRKYTKENIIDCAYKIVEKDGYEGLNARSIANYLGCSVQPIFHNFSNMKELNFEVYKKLYDKYKEYMLVNQNQKNPYKEMGLSYIRFAKDYPNFFKILFMSETKLNADDFIMKDALSDEIIETGRHIMGLSFEEQKKFHVKVWIFTHGIACLMTTKTINFTDEEINELLEKSIRQMLIGYQKERGTKDEKNN